MPTDLAGVVAERDADVGIEPECRRQLAALLEQLERRVLSALFQQARHEPPSDLERVLRVVPIERVIEHPLVDLEAVALAVDELLDRAIALRDHPAAHR